MSDKKPAPGGDSKPDQSDYNRKRGTGNDYLSPLPVPPRQPPQRGDRDAPKPPKR